MSENIKATRKIETTEATERTAAVETAETAPQYTVEYILSQIAEIQKQTIYLHEVIAQLSAMSDGDSGDCGSPGNIQGQAKAQALGDIVRCRETTNQQMLAIYEKMLDRLTEEDKTAKQIIKMSALTEWAKTLKCEEYNDQVWEVINNALYEKLQDA